MKDDNLEEFLEKQKGEAEERAAQKRAQKHDLKFIDLTSTKAPTEIKAMETVSKEEARRGRLVPIQLVGKELVVAVFNPSRKETEEVIEKLKKDYTVKLVVTSLSGLKEIWKNYEYIKEGGEKITGAISVDPGRIKELKDEVSSREDLSQKIDEFNEPQTSKVLEIVLGGAMALRASDIHIEPASDKNVLRLRVDGILHVVSESLDDKTRKSLVTRIKLLSNMKLNVTDEPQDGRFTFDLPDRDIELRTSIIPSEYGEGVVMRLLDPNSLKVELEDLGWREDDLEIVEQELKRPNGLILNTGPTGSGKTTTLYAFLKRKNSPEIKIITVEDPIEYHIEGISQTQVDRDSGYTFAKGLRSIVRQDPDVILVGEIRDEETADIALNASLTGHLVFSTLHTNSAVGAIPRLLDLGSQPNVLAPSLSLIIAQRLVRVLCKSCKKKLQIEKEEKEKIKEFLEELPDRVDTSKHKDFEIYKAEGCKECDDLGYRGRTGVFEILQVTEDMENIIYEKPNEAKLKKLAREQGMVKMQEDGVLKVLSGNTSFKEVERVTGPIEWLG